MEPGAAGESPVPALSLLSGSPTAPGVGAVPFLPLTPTTSSSLPTSWDPPPTPPPLLPKCSDHQASRGPHSCLCPPPTVAWVPPFLVTQERHSTDDLSPLPALVQDSSGVQVAERTLVTSGARGTGDEQYVARSLISPPHCLSAAPRTPRPGLLLPRWSLLPTPRPQTWAVLSPLWHPLPGGCHPGSCLSTQHPSQTLQLTITTQCFPLTPQLTAPPTSPGRGRNPIDFLGSTCPKVDL